MPPGGLDRGGGGMPSSVARRGAQTVVTSVIVPSRTTMNCPTQMTASSQDGPRVVGGEGAGALDGRSPAITRSCQEPVTVPDRARHS